MILLNAAQHMLDEARENWMITHSASDRLAYDQACARVAIMEARLNSSLR